MGKHTYESGEAGASVFRESLDLLTLWTQVPVTRAIVPDPETALRERALSVHRLHPDEVHTIIGWAVQLADERLQGTSFAEIKQQEAERARILRARANLLYMGDTALIPLQRENH